MRINTAYKNSIIYFHLMSHQHGWKVEVLVSPLENRPSTKYLELKLIIIWAKPASSNIDPQWSGIDNERVND